jgi:heme-degrading monooxygenase HmoA
MYMNVFRSRKRDGYDAAAYAEDAARMGELAQAQPGFVDYKSFAAPDGETVTISIWESTRRLRPGRVIRSILRRRRAGATTITPSSRCMRPMMRGCGAFPKVDRDLPTG